jgi:hypothetical protein
MVIISVTLFQKQRYGILPWLMMVVKTMIINTIMGYKGAFQTVICTPADN